MYWQPSTLPPTVNYPLCPIPYPLELTYPLTKNIPDYYSVCCYNTRKPIQRILTSQEDRKRTQDISL